MPKGAAVEPALQTTTASIAGSLREAINSGELPANAPLPSYRSIAASYGVAINTAREAIRMLVAEGQVIVRHGAGTFVRSHTPMMRFTGNRYATTDDELAPFRAECKRLGKVADIRFLDAKRVRPPRVVAEILDVSTSSRTVVCRRSLHAADGVPVQLIVAYVPWTAEYGDTFIKAAGSATHQDIYGYLASRGIEIARSRDEVSTRMPSSDEIQYLQLPPGTPVLDILHTGFDKADEPVEVTRFVMRGDQSVVLVDQPVNQRS